MSNASDFIIENGVLIKYVGPGGDVIIPEEVTSIEEKAFRGCDSLVRVVIPDSVTEIGLNAFAYCERLQDVKLSKNIDEINVCTFYTCPSLKSIQIPDGVTRIWWNVFSYCKSLTHITIPDSVAQIDEIFIGCESLRIHIRDIYVLPVRVRRNAAICFLEDGGDPSDPRSNTHFKFIKANAVKMMDQIIENTEMLAVMHREKLLTPKNALAYLEAAQTAGNTYAIALLLDYNANKLTASAKQRAEKQTEVLGKRVFDRCIMRQKKVGIDGLKFVVTGAVETFSNRESLKKFIKSKGGSLVSSISSKVDYLIMNNNVLETAKRQKAAELGIEVITEQQFNQMAQRTMQIEDGILVKYNGLGGDVVIPETVIEIGETAFADCETVTSIQLPNSVHRIGHNAFKNCTSLTAITIPPTIRYLSGSMFVGCTGLADTDGFIIIGDTLYGYVGEDENVTIPDAVQKIGTSAFNTYETLRSVAIPDSVTVIEGYAFAGCKKLKNVSIPVSVTSIGMSAFCGCTALTDIIIPASVVEMQTGTFKDCKKLTIHTPAGSYAETYAKENNIPFVAE